MLTEHSDMNLLLVFIGIGIGLGYILLLSFARYLLYIYTNLWILV